MQHLGSPARCVGVCDQFYKRSDTTLVHTWSTCTTRQCSRAASTARRPIITRAHHASDCDRIQENFLEEIGIDDVNALCDFNLAPLALRRDITMLSLIHRTVIGQSPSHFHRWFYIERNGNRRSLAAEITHPNCTNAETGRS